MNRVLPLPHKSQRNRPQMHLGTQALDPACTELKHNKTEPRTVG